MRLSCSRFRACSMGEVPARAAGGVLMQGARLLSDLSGVVPVPRAGRAPLLPWRPTLSPRGQASVDEVGPTPADRLRQSCACGRSEVWPWAGRIWPEPWSTLCRGILAAKSAPRDLLQRRLRLVMSLGTGTSYGLYIVDGLPDRAGARRLRTARSRPRCRLYGDGRA